MSCGDVISASYCDSCSIITHFFSVCGPYNTFGEVVAKLYTILAYLTWILGIPLFLFTKQTLWAGYTIVSLISLLIYLISFGGSYNTVIVSMRPYGSCSTTCGMPSMYSLMNISLNTFTIFYSITHRRWNTLMKYKIITVTTVLFAPACWARVHLGYNSGPQILIGSIIGLFVGFFLWLFLCYNSYPDTLFTRITDKEYDNYERRKKWIPDNSSPQTELNSLKGSLETDDKLQNPNKASEELHLEEGFTAMKCYTDKPLLFVCFFQILFFVLSLGYFVYPIWQVFIIISVFFLFTILSIIYRWHNLKDHIVFPVSLNSSTNNNKPRNSVKYFKRSLGLIIIDSIIFIYFFTFLLGVFIMPNKNLETWSLGAITHNTANVMVRWPNVDAFRVQYKLSQGPFAWNTTSSYLALPENDNVAVITIMDLQPATIYNYRVQIRSTNLRWRLAEKNGKIDSFQTLPIHKLSFAFGSCILKSIGDSFSSFDRIALTHPDFVLFLGDIIYDDQPANFGSDHYNAKYRQVYADKNFQKLFRRTPLFSIYDDHEISNDYSKGMHTPTFQAGITSWRRYASHTIPTFNSNLILSNSSTTIQDYDYVSYYPFYANKSCFFVLDTRAYRSPNNDQDSPNKTMLGEKQVKELKRWLLEANKTCVVIFLASSVPWTANDPYHDVWANFRTERDSILDWIEIQNIVGIWLLSGDRHMVGIFEVRPGIYEATVSPIHAYPAPMNVIKGTHDKTLFVSYNSRHFGTFTIDYNGTNGNTDVILTIWKYSILSSPGAMIKCYEQRFAKNGARFFPIH